jgi:hypothetical protein
MGGIRAEGGDGNHFVFSYFCVYATAQGTHKGIIDVCGDTREMYCLQQNCVSN